MNNLKKRHKNKKFGGIGYVIKNDNLDGCESNFFDF